MRARVFLFLCLFVLVGVARAQGAVPLEQKFTVDGVARVALIAAPARVGVGKKVPVLFAFHGHGGSMHQASRSFGYERLWPEAVIVYMQGLPTPGIITDAEGRRSGWQARVGDQNDRDLKFFDAVLASVQKRYPVDAKRVFATGHSNGGAFTYLLCAERGNTLAAIAPSATLDPRSLLRLKPKPTLHVAGKNDPLVHFRWQTQMMRAVRRVNHCAETGRVWAKSGALVGTFYPSQKEAPFVEVIHPGTHQFPAGAAELIVKFFREVKATTPTLR